MDAFSLILADEREGNFERKFKDPDGVIFDISKHGWQGTDSYSKEQEIDEPTSA